MTNELYHYGVLGMHWGIRRYQPYPSNYKGNGREVGQARRDTARALEGKTRGDIFEKDHTIRKGTKVYRVSTSVGDIKSGPTYITYLPADRDMYRSLYREQLLKQRKMPSSTNTYETTYVLKEDLNIPSRDTVEKVFNDLLQDEKWIKAVSQARVDLWVDRHKSDILSYYYTEFKKRGAPIELFMNYTDDIISREGNKKMSEVYKEIKESSDPTRRFIDTSWTLGTNSEFKKEVIKKLEKMGYNAMSDEASIVGLGKQYQIEGIDPLIVFDSANKFDQVSSELTTAKVFYEARGKANYWLKQANQSLEKDEWRKVNR